MRGLTQKERFSQAIRSREALEGGGQRRIADNAETKGNDAGRRKWKKTRMLCFPLAGLSVCRGSCLFCYLGKKSVEHMVGGVILGILGLAQSLDSRMNEWFGSLGDSPL